MSRYLHAIITQLPLFCGLDEGVSRDTVAPIEMLCCRRIPVAFLFVHPLPLGSLYVQVAVRSGWFPATWLSTGKLSSLTREALMTMFGATRRN